MLFRKSGVRYVYYVQMFLLALALVSLTIILVWVGTIIDDCHDEIKGNGSENASFFKNDEEFCFQVLNAKVNI